MRRCGSSSPTSKRCYNFATVVPHSAFKPAFAKRPQRCCKYLRGRAPIAKRHAARWCLCAATSREHFDARCCASSRAARVLNESMLPMRTRGRILSRAPRLCFALCSCLRALRRATPFGPWLFESWRRARFLMPSVALALLALLLCAILPVLPPHDPNGGRALLARATASVPQQSQVEEAGRARPEVSARADVLRWRARSKAASRLHGEQAG